MTPEYIPLPAPKTTCPHFGLSRTGMYNLIAPTKENGGKPPVPGCQLKTPGKTRGKWLVPYQAMKAYLDAKRKSP